MIVLTAPLYALLLIPLLPAAYRLAKGLTQPDTRFASVADARRVRTTWRIRLVRALPACQWFGLLLIVLALTGPRLESSTHTRVADAIAMVMAVDVSGSMGMRDLPTEQGRVSTRLGVAKTSFADFIDGRADDLIGLVTFAGRATTRAPLTLDHQALVSLLDTVDLPDAPGGGAPESGDSLLTALGDAMVTACARLDETEIKSRVIVLLTDGIANAGDTPPRQAARIAARLGIRIYTIGLHPGAGDRQHGQALLPEIAEVTGGVHFDAGNTQGLADALEAISAMEKTPVRAHSEPNDMELWPLCIWLSVLCLLTGMSFNLWLRGRVT